MKIPILVLAPLLAAPAFAADAAQADVPALVRAQTRFAVSVYRRLGAAPGDLFFSPYSVFAALGMTYDGAGGRTRAEIEKVLAPGLSGERLGAAFARLDRELAERAADDGCSLSVANALWGQRGARFRAPFLARVRQGYGAGFRPADFERDPEGARAAVNAWVSRETRGRIGDLVGRGVFDRDTRLALVDAVYFHARWQSAFERRNTADGAFYADGRRAVRVPFMAQTETFGYAETPELQEIELPYRGGDFSFVVVLPRARAGLPALERGLTPAVLSGWLARLSPREVEAILPKLELKRSFRLDAVLKSLGLGAAFSRANADFSGINGRRAPDPKALYLSAALHEAYVSVDEEGTTAAAATAMLMRGVGAMREELPPVFRADHPFLFLIRDRRSGAILFLGRFSEPRRARGSKDPLAS
ncbi:MAG: serpin family protein [Elusimicrobia bacterium]|nr:serpin family protein [Elusimicrobiota bacterium]